VENPTKAEKWKCLEEMVWLQHGSNEVLQYLHWREAETLDFTGIEHLDPDRADSFGPEVMEQLHQLRIAFIRKRIGEEKKATFSFPTLVRKASEDERQEAPNFFRPFSSRVKMGRSSYTYSTAQRDVTSSRKPREADEAVPDNGKHSEDKFEDPETVEIRGNAT
jgi:hypothetical protein